jgi:hypothetical protein
MFSGRLTAVSCRLSAVMVIVVTCIVVPKCEDRAPNPQVLAGLGLTRMSSAETLWISAIPPGHLACQPVKRATATTLKNRERLLGLNVAIDVPKSAMLEDDPSRQRFL